MSVESMRMIQVKRLAREDVPKLEEMYTSFSPLGATLGLPPCDSARRQKWIEDLLHGINLVSFIDGKLGGHSALLPTLNTLEFVAFVHQDFRRLGVGTELMRAAIEEARAGGYSHIWLLIAKNNIAAQLGLQKLGFRVAWDDMREMEFTYVVQEKRR